MSITLDHRMKVIIAAAVMVALIAGGWFLGIQPALGAAFGALSQRDTVQTQNTAAEAALAALAAAQPDLPKLQGDLAGITASVPSQPETEAFLDGVDGIASRAGVTVQSVVVEDAVPYVPPVVDTTSTASGSSSSTSSSTAASDVTTTDPALVPYSDPRITGSNLVAIPVTLEVAGNLDQVLAFVAGIQSGSRLFLVDKLDTVADAGSGTNGSVTGSVAGYIYVLLDTAAATPAA